MIAYRTLRLAVAAAALTTAATATAATAHAQSPIKFGLAGGVALPMGDFADAYDAGYNGTVTLAFNAPLIPVGLRVDGMFNRMSGQEDALLTAPDVDVSSVNANVTFNLLPLPVAKVYLIGGAGYYSTKLRDTGFDAEGNIGYNAGLGVRVGMGTQLFVEGRYHRVNLDNDAKLDFVPVTIGLMF
ncbi:MAG: hypothetical protein AVDCRST_MAG40-2965 [uncultured Gemmatimonadaceae bacterium]|uniref:Outer membrane protein beta-barrel domain-containing protein n=1 Tax=uncultured Gemmatimonadaceae bacterium TaxID=246130 RepID=A0A6J4M872_9BACT|nr:MAG: hypothetical protein AVDCRST_MAG40-2965 [uncultured Gemmatimonadaceae bacterium]